MVSLGRPGAGEQLLESYGFLDIERTEVPFAWEFADPQMYARALAASGPAYEAIQNVGEAEFHRAAVQQAQGQLRSGLPLRAEIKVVGYLARNRKGNDAYDRQLSERAPGVCRAYAGSRTAGKPESPTCLTPCYHHAPHPEPPQLGGHRPGSSWGAAAASRCTALYVDSDQVDTGGANGPNVSR